MKTKLSMLLVLVVLFAVSGQVFAINVGDMAGGLSAQFVNIKGAIVGAGFVLGALLAVGGVYLIYKDSKQPGQDNFKKGLIGLIAGALLLSLPLLVDTTTSSVFGSNATSYGGFNAGSGALR